MLSLLSLLAHALALFIPSSLPAFPRGPSATVSRTANHVSSSPPTRAVAVERQSPQRPSSTPPSMSVLSLNMSSSLREQEIPSHGLPLGTSGGTRKPPTSPTTAPWRSWLPRILFSSSMSVLPLLLLPPFF